MATLSYGSRGPAVQALQAQLNKVQKPTPPLVVDGAFGMRTQAAVKAYQAAAWLVEDGIVGPCTSNALFGKETYAPILHDVPFIPQPTNTTCWAASTAMITKSTVPQVIAKTPASEIGSSGGLRNYSSTDDAVTGGTRFAQAHGLILTPPMSWGLMMLREAMKRGPLMFDMLWNVSAYVNAIGSPGHMIVVVGMRGDDDPSGKGTTLRIHDPWSPNVGARYSVNHMKWMQEVPTRTYRVFQKRAVPTLTLTP